MIGALIGAILAIVIIVAYELIVDQSKNDSLVVNDTPVENSDDANENVDDMDEKEDSEEFEEETVKKESIELAMIGDVLLHTELAVYEDFSPSLAPVEKFLQAPDFLIANQESLPVASKFGISGYPQFSSPDYILRDLKEAGIDMINMANNHAIDKYEAGLAFAIENVEKEGFPYVGAFKNAEDRATPRIVDVKGIKIGFLSYTYGTNGLFLPQGSPYIVNYIDIKKMKEDVAILKPQVDVTVMIIHWGAEYVTKHNEEQTYIAKMMNEAGVDIIFGGHPHVLQPYEKIVNSAGQETHVFYSFGNFFARTISSEETNIGGIVSLLITKEGDQITIDQPKLIATSLLKDTDGFYKVFPLAEVEDKSIRNMEWVKSILGPDVLVQ